MNVVKSRKWIILATVMWFATFVIFSSGAHAADWWGTPDQITFNAGNVKEHKT